MKMEQNQKLSCPKCGKTVNGNYELRKHMQLHGEAFLDVPPQSKLPKCPECDKTFSDNYCVNRHMQNVHMKATTGMPLNVKISRCPECDKTFSDNYGVKRHMKVHGKNTDGPSSENASPPVVCKVCDKVFHSTKNMKRHLKIHKDEIGENDGRIDVGANSAMGEHPDVVCETPLVISLSDNDGDNGVALGPGDMESEKLADYTNTAVSLCKSCSQCGKELRDKWALRRHMAMHAYSDGVRVQEESPPKANDSNETETLDELFDPRSIDNEIEFLQKEAKKYREAGEGQDEQNEAKQLKQNWQLPAQNTCEVFLQPAMTAFQPPWNMGQKVQNIPVQNIQQENLGIYRFQPPAFFGTPTQNIFGSSQNILTHSNLMSATTQDLAGQSEQMAGSPQDLLKQRQNLQILPFPGYSFQYVTVPATKHQDVSIAMAPSIAMGPRISIAPPIATAPPIAMAPPTVDPSNLQPRVGKQEWQAFEDKQESKVSDRRGNTCHLCDKKFQSNYNMRRHLKTHSNEDISCPNCGNRFKTTEYLTKHSKNCTLSKTLQNTQYATNSVQDKIPKPMATPQLDLEISSENTSTFLSVPEIPPLSAALQHEVLEKFAQVDKIVQELQQLAH